MTGKQESGGRRPSTKFSVSVTLANGYGVWIHLVNAMDDLIVAIVRGESARWPAEAGREEQTCFLRAATGHGVLPLLAHQLHQANTLDQWPEPLRDRFVHAARQEVLVESLRRSERSLSRSISPGARWQARPLSQGQAMLALLGHTVPARRRPRSALATLRKVVASAAVVKGVRGEAEQLCDALLSTADPRASAASVVDRPRNTVLT